MVEVDGDRTQPVINDIIIKAVKAEAAKSLPPKKKAAAASQPREWKVILKQWFDRQDMPKVKTPDGEFWRVRRKRKDVYAELGAQPVLKITFKSFERMTRPDSFPTKTDFPCFGAMTDAKEAGSGKNSFSAHLFRPPCPCFDEPHSSERRLIGNATIVGYVYATYRRCSLAVHGPRSIVTSSGGICRLRSRWVRSTTVRSRLQDGLKIAPIGQPPPNNPPLKQEKPRRCCRRLGAPGEVHW